MTTAPLIDLYIQRFTAWRCAVGSVMVAAAFATLAWLVDAVSAGSLLSLWHVALVSGGLAALMLLAWRETLVRPFQLRWDGENWWVDEQVGSIGVMQDLGSFMLLKFRPVAARERWLPVQRGRSRSQWHALRCAVYAPRGPLPNPDRVS